MGIVRVKDGDKWKVVQVIGNSTPQIKVVQETGESTEDVMSQKAVTEIIGNIETLLSEI